MMYDRLTATACAGMLCAATLASGDALADSPYDGPAPGVPGTVVFTGSAYKEDASFTYVGAVAALNHNLGVDGWLVRGFGGYGEYEYDTVAVPGGNVEADMYKADVGIGYQKFMSPLFRVTAYALANYEDHDIEPFDPNNSVNGSEWGFKGRLEFATTAAAAYDFNLSGEYSTAFRTYWADLRVGMKLHNGIAIGPEIIVQGNEEFDEIMYGAYIHNVPSLFGFKNSTWGASVGWADTRRNQGNAVDDNDSFYGILRSNYLF